MSAVFASGTDVLTYMNQLGVAARAAARATARASTAQKNAALAAIADALDQGRAQLAAENDKDLQGGRAKGLDDAMLDRLALTPARIDTMLAGLAEVAALPDPVGAIDDLRFRPSGIQVGRMRVPLGVVGIIYESRPNVTADAAALCLKSGNATVLRGGSEAIHSNQAIVAAIHHGLEAAGLPAPSVQLVGTTDRAAVAVGSDVPYALRVEAERGVLARALGAAS